jgi:hypothetical protein
MPTDAGNVCFLGVFRKSLFGTVRTGFGTFETCQRALRTSALRGISEVPFEGAKTGFVKVFGCRPHEGGAAHTGAGVRKPPMEETAMGERMMVPRS